MNPPGGPPLPAPSYAGGPAGYRGQASSSSSPPPPPQGHTIEPPVPPPQHAIKPVWPWVGQRRPPLPFGFGPPVPRPIPPLHPQFWPQQHPYHLPPGPTVWGPTSNQRPAAPTWPQQPQFAQHPPTIHQDWKLEVIRSNLLRHPMALEQLVMSSDREYSAILVHRLNIGDEQMREMVLERFKQCGDAIMGSRQGHAVFQALLRSIQAIIVNDRQYDEVIFRTMVQPNPWSRPYDFQPFHMWISAEFVSPSSVRMMQGDFSDVAHHGGGVEPGPVHQALVNCFVRDRVMDDFGGGELIAHCFTRMDYDVTKALVTHAMDTIEDKLNSPYGHLIIRYARGEELHLFQDTLVERALLDRCFYLPNLHDRLATTCSNRLVQSLLDPDMDRIEFRRQLLSRLMQHVVISLSNNWYGRFVLRHCFTSEDKELQPIALTACADLPQGDFQTLANHFLPLHRVLQGGTTDYPVTARRLARKIQALPPYIREHRDIHMRLAMSAVRRVFADNLADLGN
ncbi:hypothetical protein VPH35_079243 [Triticum aestivum]